VLGELKLCVQLSVSILLYGNKCKGSVVTLASEIACNSLNICIW
jgi:hypothetical protein